MIIQLPFCKCGCGRQVEKKSRKYCEGHYAIFRKTGKPVVDTESTAETILVEETVPGVTFSQPETSKALAEPIVKDVVINTPKVKPKKLTPEEKRQLFLKNLNGNRSLGHLRR